MYNTYLYMRQKLTNKILKIPSILMYMILIVINKAFLLLYRYVNQ